MGTAATTSQRCVRTTLSFVARFSHEVLKKPKAIDPLPRQAQDECKRRQQLKKGGCVCCCCCLQVFDDKAFAEWLVTNFGTGAALYGQTNASVASFDTVGTLLKTYASLSVHLEPVLANDRIPQEHGKASKRSCLLFIVVFLKSISTVTASRLRTTAEGRGTPRHRSSRTILWPVRLAGQPGCSLPILQGERTQHSSTTS
eukprot:COSAG06_NODE_224_length_19789_cov_2569.875622_13_plen_200_part_00